MQRRRVIAALCGAAALLAACSGSEGGSAETTPPTTEAAATTVVETTAAPTTVAETVPATDAPTTTAQPADPLAGYAWSQAVDGAPWGGRAGLRVMELDGALFVAGGRTPRNSPIPGDSDLWGDVWRSDDLGVSWTQTLASGDAFAPRAYFQSVVHDGAMYVLGGQNFGFPSTFFNDVWRSTDGVTWEQTTAAAPWSARAGLMAASLGDSIYVFGGSRNDDAAVVGPTGPVREYFNDVWRSDDGGFTWVEATAAAEWSPRAGGAVAVHQDAIYLLGGEVGFICQPFPGCEPPYFNDVWRSTDGATWELVVEAAGWSTRPGYQCESIVDEIVCFGGFGQGENPIDTWASPDGAEWRLLDAKPWGATTPEQGRYDFDSTVITTPAGPAVVTVGGDRETFEFGDPENWLRVDDDVWWFAPA
jgi:hypothetical protein